MRYFKYTLLLFCLCSKAFAQNADTVYTLQQCIDIAIKNNLDVRKSNLQLEADRIYWQQARENLLPGFSADVSHSVSTGRSQDPTTYTYVNQSITTGQYALNAGVTLFNGMSLQNRIKQQSLAYQAGQMDYQQAKENITLSVITTYLSVLDNEDQFTQVKTQLDVSVKQLDRAEILNKDGNIAPQTLYDLRGQSANDKLSIINTRSAVYAAKLNLLQIMNVPFSKDVKLQRLTADQLPGAYTATSDQIYAKALTDLSLVKAADLRQKSAEKGVSATKGNLLPSLSLNGGLLTNYSSGQSTSYGDQFKNNYSTYGSLGLHIPILNSFKSKNAVSLAKIDYLNAKYTAESTKIQLKQSIEQAYVNMTAAYERYQVLGDQVAAYSESFRIAEVRFNDGDLTSVDYLVAKSNMDRAKTGLINARYDYFIRTKILDYYQGKLAL
ncbi:MAG: TolC family protein [Bacteroidota bacterium]